MDTGVVELTAWHKIWTLNSGTKFAHWGWASHEMSVACISVII